MHACICPALTTCCCCPAVQRRSTLTMSTRLYSSRSIYGAAGEGRRGELGGVWLGRRGVGGGGGQCSDHVGSANVSPWVPCVFPPPPPPRVSAKCASGGCSSSVWGQRSQTAGVQQRANGMGCSGPMACWGLSCWSLLSVDYPAPAACLGFRVFAGPALHGPPWLPLRGLLVACTPHC